MASLEKATKLFLLLTSGITQILFGAVLAMFLILLFLSGVHDPDPAWGPLWEMKPMIMLPIAGAIGGGFFYLMNLLSHLGVINKGVAIIVGLIGYVVALWLGTVLGLNGTLWN